MFDPKILEEKRNTKEKYLYMDCRLSYEKGIEEGKEPLILPPPKNTEHRELIISLCKLFQPKVYVELGVKTGFVFNEVAKYVKKAIGVDCGGFTRQTESVTNAELYHTTTDSFVGLWKKNHIEADIDLLFIDANHEKKQVLKDFFGLEHFVRSDTGLILLHDTYPFTKNLTSERYCRNAYEAAYTIRREYPEQFEIVTLPGPIAGISIIRKAIKQVHWL